MLLLSVIPHPIESIAKLAYIYIYVTETTLYITTTLSCYSASSLKFNIFRPNDVWHLAILTCQDNYQMKLLSAHFGLVIAY